MMMMMMMMATTMVMAVVFAPVVIGRLLAAGVEEVTATPTAIRAPIQWAAAPADGQTSTWS